MLNNNIENGENPLERKQFYFGVVAVMVFLILNVLLYLFFRLGMQESDWVVFYVLIGLIGGLVFYLVDPLRSQEFKWKGVANIGVLQLLERFLCFSQII